MDIKNDIPPPPPDKKVDKINTGVPDLRTLIAAPSSADKTSAVAQPKSDVNTKDQVAQSDMRPDARQEALNRLDNMLVDPEKTKGHEVLNWLKNGLAQGNPAAFDAKEAFGKILYDKISTGTDTFKYDSSRSKVDDFRIKLELTKADANELLKIVEPPDRTKYIGEGGHQGSAQSFKDRIAIEKFQAALEPGSTFGQIAATITYLKGGSVEDIRLAGRSGDTIEAVGFGVSNIGAARENNLNTGRNATKELSARRNIPEARPEAKKPIESSNAQRYGLGDDPKTHTDEFSGNNNLKLSDVLPSLDRENLKPNTVDSGANKYAIVGSREARSGANQVDRATVAESHDYNKQIAPKELGGNGKVGIQRPGRVNEGGPDSIVYDPNRNVIEIRDTKLRGPDGSFPKVDDKKLEKWKNEADRAINGDKNDASGGCRTGDAKLDAAIRKAWADGRAELVQVNVRGPALPEKGDYVNLRKFF